MVVLVGFFSKKPEDRSHFSFVVFDNRKYLDSNANNEAEQLERIRKFTLCLDNRKNIYNCCKFPVSSFVNGFQQRVVCGRPSVTFMMKILEVPQLSCIFVLMSVVWQEWLTA